MLLENAAHTIVTAVSGQSFVQASMSAAGTSPRHASGLDVKICGEVARAACGMPRTEANQVVKQLLAIYEPDLPKKLVGQPFEEVYDLKTIRPTKEWQGTYNGVRKELIAMGLPLDRLK